MEQWHKQDFFHCSVQFHSSAMAKLGGDPRLPTPSPDPSYFFCHQECDGCGSHGGPMCLFNPRDAGTQGKSRIPLIIIHKLAPPDPSFAVRDGIPFPCLHTLRGPDATPHCLLPRLLSRCFPLPGLETGLIPIRASTVKREFKARFSRSLNSHLFRPAFEREASG